MERRTKPQIYRHYLLPLYTDGVRKIQYGNLGIEGWELLS
jgi:hypothetical protein